MADDKNQNKDAYTLILDAIDTGIYRPGDRLVESELAERFGVSRTPIREALQRLETQSLLTRDGRSMIVASLDHNQLAELYVVRSELEALAARLAARHATEEEINVLRDMTEGLYTRIDDIANFAADVAHEIKNPLTSLRSASDTLRVAKTAEQREKLINIIQQDVSRMDRLITDISKASKVDANLAHDTAMTLNIAEITENIVEFYQQTRSGEGPMVRDATELDPDNPSYIRAYETPFAQVLRNLIDNALTFSPDDGVVTVTASAQGKRVFITVDDQGPGIPSENLDTVFDRFYTQRPKGASFGSHSGLGLAICRQIITAHRGEIHAENRMDDDGTIIGARFVINVPRQRPRSS